MRASNVLTFPKLQLLKPLKFRLLCISCLEFVILIGCLYYHSSSSTEQTFVNLKNQMNLILYARFKWISNFYFIQLSFLYKIGYSAKWTSFWKIFIILNMNSYEIYIKQASQSTPYRTLLRHHLSPQWNQSPKK